MEITNSEQVFDGASKSGDRAQEGASGEEDQEVWKLVLIILGAILGVLILMYLIRRFIQGGQYTKKNRIDGKVVIITGCNTGIGKETAKELAKRGGKIYMACRDPKRCEDARLEIIEKTKNQNIFNRTLDLSSLESIRKFAAKFKEEETRLDILINNAGIMGCPKRQTADGFESQIGVNHLGHFLLTNLLLDRIQDSAPSRIVVVSSLAYMNGKINRDDLNSEKSYSKVGAYSQSKLTNVLFTRHLAKKLEGTNVIVNCCHPGLVRTEIGRHFIPGFIKFKEEETRLDILINNAGIMACPKYLTADGFESQIGVNHLGHFLLTNLLLDRIQDSAPSRIVVLSSVAYMNGKINRDDLNSEKSYSKVGAYSQSKLANVLFTRHLAKKLEGTNVIVNCCHPGVVKTELGRHLFTGYVKKIADPIASCLMKTPKSGAQTSIKLAIDPDLTTSGGFYADCIQFPVLKRAKDDDTAEWLWKISEEWTGLSEKNENKTTVEININNEGKENEKTK